MNFFSVAYECAAVYEYAARAHVILKHVYTSKGGLVFGPRCALLKRVYGTAPDNYKLKTVFKYNL